MAVPSLALELEPLNESAVLTPAVWLGPALATGARWPDWLTVTVWPATVQVPEREAELVLLSIVIVAVPEPVPLLVVWSQLALLAAVQEQVEPEAVTLTLVLAPTAPDVMVLGDT